jgi:uncharacterized protein
MQDFNLKLKGTNSTCYFNPTSKKQKVLILLGGSEGGNYWNNQESYIESLVKNDYFVISVGYFGIEGLPKILGRIALESFEELFDWLEQQKNLQLNNYGIIGKSRGGELALLLASRYSKIKMTIALVPSSVIFVGSIKSLIWPKQISAWSYQKQELPFLPLKISIQTIYYLLKGPRIKVFECALQNQERAELARIPIEKAQSSILLVSALKDQIWPSVKMCQTIERKLANEQYQYPFQHIQIESLHDVFQNNTTWSIILNFLKKNFPAD